MAAEREVAESQGPEERFNIVLFYPDGRYNYVERGLSSDHAVRLAITTARMSPDADRVIITDMGDCTNWEWKRGEGIVFPPELKGRQV